LLNAGSAPLNAERVARRLLDQVIENDPRMTGILRVTMSMAARRAAS
jgi:hypothetical protein